MSKLFTTILPSMLAGGLLFASVLGHAGPGSGAPPIPPAPPAPPAAIPAPPAPPAPPAIPGLPAGVNVTIKDGKVHIEGIDKYVDQQLDSALKSVQGASVPPEIRTKVEERIKKVREKMKKRLAKINASNLDDLGDQLGELGDEIGDEMDQFGSDMDAWGEQFGKNVQAAVAKQLAARGIHVDDDDDDDHDLATPDVDDDDDLADAVRDLGDLSLKPDQRAQIAKLRADSDKQVAAAKKALDAASDGLKKALESSAVSDAEVGKAIDAVSQQEAAIRKARILAWVNARRILDDGQRKKVEGAAKKTK